MKLIACLSVYNEIQFIKRVVKSLRRGGIDRAIAIDGAYQGFPHDTWASDDGTPEYLRQVAAETKGWLILVEAPAEGWPGQEVKRTVYFREADKIAQPGDWLVQVDGDEELLEDGADYRGRRVRDFLAEQSPIKTTCWTGVRNFIDGQEPSGWDHWAKLYKWQPGMYYGREHWDILGPNGERIWDKALEMTSPQSCAWHYLQFNHLTEGRTNERKNIKSNYENFRAEQRRLYGCMNPNPTSEVDYE